MRKAEYLPFVSTLALALSTSPVLAQDAENVEPQEEEQAAPVQDKSAEAVSVTASRVTNPAEDDFHNRALDYQGNIIVSAVGLSQLDLLAGTSVMEAGDIQRNLAGQLGDVLVKLPGVSATSFSPGASRPVLRGFQGERVRVLIDGLGSIDVSNTSVDHATTIDPLTAERIEVLRGPAVMLYGSQAIGGAVNVIDKRIPRRSPEEPVHIDGLLAFDDAYDKREGGASIDLPVSSHLVLHFDGTYRETDDVRTGGYILSDNLRQDLIADAAEELEEGHADEAEELLELAEQKGRLPNSATRTWTANGGFAIFAGESTFGASVGYYDTRYGVPLRPGAEHAHGEEGEEDHEGEEHHDEEGHEGETVSIDLQQVRADFRGDIALGSGFFEQLLLRAGYSDYTHTEFEGDEVGTTFDVQGIEARVELAQKDRGWWRGSIGGQYYYRDFYAEGAEAYVPPNVTDQYSLFTLQEFGNGPIQLETAARFEATDVEAQTLGVSRNFSTFSGAVGLVYETDQALRLGINASRAERAPSAEELFSDGPHIATQAFEIGDPTMSTETALGLEAFVRGRIGKAELSAAVYRSWFDDYIYLIDTGAEEDGLPVFQYLQDDADYFGVEAEITYPLYDNGDFTILTDLRADYIRAELDDGSPIPRIPPFSLLGALEYQSSDLDARAEVQWFAKQDRVAAFETPTDDFALVNLSLSWRPIEGEAVTLLLGVDNVFDVVGRRHASFTKEFVPLAGRNAKASLRFSF